MTANDNPFENDMPVESAGAGAGIDLSAFDEEWGETEAPDFDEVPDGKYQAAIRKAELVTSQNGHPMIKFDLVILAGSQEGRHVFKNSVITRASLPYVKGDLEKTGLVLGKLSDLPAHLPGLLDKTLEITKRTKDDRVNVYFNRLIDVPAGEDIPW